MVGNRSFSMDARSIAMTACIHGGQAQFLTASLIITGTAASSLALLTTGAGVLAGSYGTIKAGISLGTGASILNSSARFSEGNVGACLTTAAVGIATGGAFQTVQNARMLNSVDKGVLNFNILMFDTVGQTGIAIHGGRK